MEFSCCALCLGAIIVAVVVLVAYAPFFKSTVTSGGAAMSPLVEKFLDPSKNIGVYDQPYWHYPDYEGRKTLKWDSDNRCSANCQQSPCTVWCR